DERYAESAHGSHQRGRSRLKWAECPASTASSSRKTPHLRPEHLCGAVPRQRGRRGQPKYSRSAGTITRDFLGLPVPLDREPLAIGARNVAGTLVDRPFTIAKICD